MRAELEFRSYCANDKASCLNLFDENCPEFFAPNERTDYLEFLNTNPTGYEICVMAGAVVGAFGLIGQSKEAASLNWILLSPQVQGQHIGSSIMDRVVELAKRSKITHINIAASHKSSSFFERFGACAVETIENGWGPGMHRVNMVLAL